MELFFKFYEGLNREGPGSPAVTERAYTMCTGLPDEPRILELGCGSGGATLPLAQLSEGTVVATEIYEPYLDRLMDRAEKAGLRNHIVPKVMDMSNIQAEPESFNLIWCEGAAYIMGVDKALPYWKQFLKPGGCLVFSDAVWFTREVPEEVRQFWAEGYPAMRTAEENVAAAVSFGYTSLGHFPIDDQCWLDYYRDVGRRLDELEPVYGSDPEGRAIIDMARREQSLYLRNPGVYGYEMHVLKKL